MEEFRHCLYPLMKWRQCASKYMNGYQFINLHITVALNISSNWECHDFNVDKTISVICAPIETVELGEVDVVVDFVVAEVVNFLINSWRVCIQNQSVHWMNGFPTARGPRELNNLWLKNFHFETYISLSPETENNLMLELLKKFKLWLKLLFIVKQWWWALV